MARSAAFVRAARASGPEAERRLALLEFLVATEDPQELAQRCLEWLSQYAGIRQAICLAVDAEQTRLVGLAGYGVPRTWVTGRSIDLEARDHPLIRALFSPQPVVLSAEHVNGGSPDRTLLRGGAFLALSLQGLERGEAAPVGLLLARPAFGNNRELRWVAENLGFRLGRVRTAARLAEVERRVQRDRTVLSSILDSVTDPILFTDSEGRMIVANSRAERLFGAQESESEGRRRAVAINNMLFSSALGQSAIDRRTPSPREVLLVDPAEGSDLLFELISTTAGDARAGMGIVSILRNVSDLRRATEEIEANYQRVRLAEAEVRAERDRLDVVIDSVADPILVTDPSGNLVMMNAPAERLFAVAPDASPAEAQRVRANDANFTSFVSNLLFGAGEARYHGGVSLVDPKTGNAIPVEAVSGKVFGEPAEVSTIVTILHDRTEAIEREELYEKLKVASAELERRVQDATAALVRQNELLRRQAIELEQASAAKSLFLANVSHEVRTPLNAILGYGSVLLKGVSGELAQPQREVLARIQANARQLLALITDILDFSRIEAGKMPLRLARVKLNELITETLREVEPLINRSKLAVSVDVPPTLPVLRTDRQKVKQIVLNFLTNALKFTPEGSVTVSAVYVRPSREVAIAVADTGVGILEADQARIFEPFSQAERAPAPEPGGTGLGLSICRRLAAVLDGRITIQSKVGEGSTFTLFLPVSPGRS